MITLLSRFYIKDYKNTSSPSVRSAYGILCGSVGIGLNVLLFLGKFLAGFFSGSIAITADAFNNLSDAGSSVITLLGFKLAGQKPDPEHPFGHGRIEYLSGLFVSIAILLMAVELIRSSVVKLMHPEPVTFNPLIAVILVVSILVKLYMCYYNRHLGTILGSAAMKATAADSFSDSLATTGVLAATLIAHFTHLQIDGFCGILVGLCIFYAGINAARETISPLLGQPPQPSLIQEVESIVLSHEGILGIHDLIVHDYGPGRLMLSLHAEVPSDCNILDTHDLIDNIEHDLQKKLLCEATIHMDPVCINDEETNVMKQQIVALVHAISPELSLHDFRMVKGPTHTNVIFDLVVPYQFSVPPHELSAMITQKISELGRYCAVIQIDRAYI